MKIKTPKEMTKETVHLIEMTWKQGRHYLTINYGNRGGITFTG